MVEISQGSTSSRHITIDAQGFAPRFRRDLWRARSMRMRRMACAAAIKKWFRLFQSWFGAPTNRSQTSCTNAVSNQTPETYQAHTFQFQLHSNPDQPIWTFGNIKVVRGFKTDSLLSDAALTEELLIGARQQVHKAAHRYIVAPINS